MHLYHSWRKLKNCIVKMISHLESKAIFFWEMSTVYIWVVKGRKPWLMNRQSSSQHHLPLSSASKHTLCILGTSWPLAHVSLVLFILSVNKEKVFEHICLFPLLSYSHRHRCICMHKYGRTYKTFTPILFLSLVSKWCWNTLLGHIFLSETG